MGQGTPTGVKVDRRIEAEPLLAAGWRVLPVARLVGWEMAGDERTGPFTARMGRLTPLEVHVERSDEADDEHEVLAMEDPLQEPLGGILAAAAFVAAVCTVIMLAAQVISRRP